MGGAMSRGNKRNKQVTGGPGAGAPLDEDEERLGAGETKEGGADDDNAVDLPFASHDTNGGFPTYLDIITNDGYPGRGDHDGFELPRTALELELMEVCHAIRDRIEWWLKIESPDIVHAWRMEATERRAELMLLAGGVQMKDAFELALDEARFLANHYRGRIGKPAGAEGVFVRDGLPDGLQDALVRGIGVLRQTAPVGLGHKHVDVGGGGGDMGGGDVGGHKHVDVGVASGYVGGVSVGEGGVPIDIHPGSDANDGEAYVIDFVHPGMYAYEQGVTGVLAAAAGAEKSPPWGAFLNTEQIQVEAAPPIPSKSATHSYGMGYHSGHHADPKKVVTSQAGLQWIPSEMTVEEEGGGGGGDGTLHCSINSYINSLHPEKHPDLYASIAGAFAAVVPLFENVLGELLCNDGTTSSPRQRPLRVEVPSEWWELDSLDRQEDLQNQWPPSEYDPEFDERTYAAAHGLHVLWTEDKVVGGPHDGESMSDVVQEAIAEARHHWLRRMQEQRVFIAPTLPESFVPPSMPPIQGVSLRGRPLQVITKIASIELTPERPNFGGGKLTY